MNSHEKALGKKKGKTDKFYDPKLYDQLDRSLGNGRYLTNQSGVRVTPRKT